MALSGRRISELPLLLLLWTCCFEHVVQSQVDGSFWWQNKELLQKAKESRNNKVNFKTESLTAIEHQSNTSEVHFSEEYSEMDCTCVHKCKCQVVFDFKAHHPELSSTGSICGSDQVCCHIIKLPIPRECFELSGKSSSSTQSTTTPLSTSFNPTELLPSSTQSSPRDTKASQDTFIYPDDERVLEYPFLLKLFQRHNRRGPSRVCGATLIGNKSAVTAQHCIRGSRSSHDFMVEAMDGQKRIITEIINHPQYYSGGLFNDLAILRWHEPLRINDRVDIVDLPSDYTVHFDNCTLVSFEVSANQFELIQVKEKAQLLKKDNCEVRIRGSKWGHRFRLHENFTCIDTDRRPTCSLETPRDGHPLICQQKDSGNPLLVGVMSWYNCQKSHPDVLLDIRSSAEWIHGVQDFYSF